MRITAFIFALVLSISGSAAAQDWTEYASSQDGFTINFPGQPTIAATTWMSQFDYVLPGRVYSANRGPERYSVTVIDYTSLEQQGIERAKTCPPGNAQCRENAGIMGPGYWKHDARGAVMYATSTLVKRDAKVTNLLWEWQDMVEGNLVQLTNNADQSRTFAYVTMHENKLYILEGTVPKDHPEPGLFQQSLGWIDKDGRPVRYQQIIYSNAYHGMGVYPKPTYGAQGGGRGAGAGGAGAPAGNPGR
jgi:hypothetical protein